MADDDDAKAAAWTEQFKALPALIAEGKTLGLELARSFTGTTFVRVTELGYGTNGRPLKPKPAVLDAVIVGPYPDTLRSIADLLEGS